MSEESRTVSSEVEKKGFAIADLILVAVLIAAGAVLKITVGSVINFFGMKPNFIIAMYCLAIALIRPKFYQSAIIGLIVGAVCQFLPGTPWLNFASELVGACCMYLLLKGMKALTKANLEVSISTLISSAVSGATYVVCLFVFTGAEASALVAYVPIVLCTSILNAVIVQLLYMPLKKMLKK